MKENTMEICDRCHGYKEASVELCPSACNEPGYWE